MTETERKALALVNEVFVESGQSACPSYNQLPWHTAEALCRAIEQHEAFRQEVSDALVDYFGEHLVGEDGGDALARFIIAKPDPLVEAYNEALPETAAVHGKETVQHICAKISAAIEARGGRIVWEGE